MTRKSTPESLKAEKLARDFPALKDFKVQTTGSSLANYEPVLKEVMKQYLEMGANGVLKSGIGKTPEAAMIKSLIQNSGQIQPLSKRTERMYAQDKDSEPKLLQEFIEKA